MNRGQVAGPRFEFVIPVVLALSLYVGWSVYQQMQTRLPDPIGERTLCACGIGLPPSEAAGVVSLGVLVVVVLIGVFGRSFFVARFSSGGDTDE